MKDNYDFTNARPNPYARRLKKQVTIRLDETTLGYFKAMAERDGIPYQTLINLYLRDCAATRRTLDLLWRTAEERGAG
ncbi:MAG: BrnA antitoxin family protein [Myxococcota bacterium]